MGHSLLPPPRPDEGVDRLLPGDYTLAMSERSAQVPGAIVPADAGGQALSIPQLSHDQAMYISLLMESGRPEIAEKDFADLYQTLPSLDVWSTDPAFIESLELADTNRPLLFRAMSHALFGKAFRALSRMLDSPKSAGKGVELLTRLHGMLIDRVRDERPDEFRELIHMLRQRIEPVNSDIYVRELPPSAGRN